MGSYFSDIQYVQIQGKSLQKTTIKFTYFDKRNLLGCYHRFLYFFLHKRHEEEEERSAERERKLSVKRER